MFSISGVLWTDLEPKYIKGSIEMPLWFLLKFPTITVVSRCSCSWQESFFSSKSINNVVKSSFQSFLDLGGRGGAVCEVEWIREVKSLKSSSSSRRGNLALEMVPWWERWWKKCDWKKRILRNTVGRGEEADICWERKGSLFLEAKLFFSSGSIQFCGFLCIAASDREVEKRWEEKLWWSWLQGVLCFQFCGILVADILVAHWQEWQTMAETFSREWQNPNCCYKSSKPFKLKKCWTLLSLISNNFSLSSCLQPHSFAHVWKTFHWNHIETNNQIWWTAATNKSLFFFCKHNVA